MNCWQSLALQSRLLCFQAFLGFLPSLTEVLLLEYTGQDAICPQGTVSNPLCRELPISRELHQSRETQISLSQNPCLEVLSWFAFFHADTAHLPFKTPHTKSHLSHLSLTWPSTWLSVLETSVPCSCPYLADPEGDGSGILIICTAADAFPGSCKGRAFMP